MNYFSLILTLIVLKTCSYNTHQDKKNMQNDISGIFEISTFQDFNLEDNLTLSFNDSTKQVSGFAGCNRFFGSYTIEKNKIKFGPIGATKMLCHGAKEKIETAFFKALESANTLSIADNELKLLDNNKIVLIAHKKETYTLTYKAFSRGTYKEVHFKKGSISYKNSLNSLPKSYTCSKEDLKKLNNFVSSIDVKNISKIESPSKAHQYDGAPGAVLSITKNDNEYKTVTFDHGNPPEEIKELVNLMLSFTESM